MAVRNGVKTEMNFKAPKAHASHMMSAPFNHPRAASRVAVKLYEDVKYTSPKSMKPTQMAMRSDGSNGSKASRGKY